MGRVGVALLRKFDLWKQLFSHRIESVVVVFNWDRCSKLVVVLTFFTSSRCVLQCPNLTLSIGQRKTVGLSLVKYFYGYGLNVFEGQRYVCYSPFIWRTLRLSTIICKADTCLSFLILGNGLLVPSLPISCLDDSLREFQGGLDRVIVVWICYREILVWLWWVRYNWLIRCSARKSRCNVLMWVAKLTSILKVWDRVVMSHDIWAVVLVRGPYLIRCLRQHLDWTSNTEYTSLCRIERWVRAS